MSKTILAGAVVASALFALPLSACSDSGPEYKADSAAEKGRSGAHGDHAGSTPQPASLANAWAALTAARDAIASDIDGGALGDIHAKAEPLPALVATLLEQSRDLDASKRARVAGAAKQVARVANSLHEAADRGDTTQTRKDLTSLDGLLELIRAQYPAGTLVDGAHGHGERPAGVVDATPQATVRVQMFDPFRFEPSRIEVQAGVPTRIEIENTGAAEHSLVVKTPDGRRDWVHLHAAPGATEAATYQLDEPGTYPLRCTIPGHTEGGMTGELVVLDSAGGTHRQ